MVFKTILIHTSHGRGPGFEPLSEYQKKSPRERTEQALPGFCYAFDFISYYLFYLFRTV